MLYFDVSIELTFIERIDVNKTSASKECDICQICYFLNKGFNFQ